MTIMTFINLISDVIEYLTALICICIFDINLSKDCSKLRAVQSVLLFTFLAALFTFILSFESISTRYFSILLYIIKFLVPPYILFKKINIKIIYIIVMIDYIIAFISSCIVCALSYDKNLNQESISLIILMIVRIVLLAFTLLLKNKTDPQKTNAILSIIPKHVYILVLGIIISLGLAASLNGKQITELEAKINILNYIIIFLSILIASIIFSLVFNVISKQLFGNRTQAMQNQVEILIRHYEKIEKINDEMRKFRHDYTGHLQSILSLIRMKEYSEAEEYIDKLKKSKQKSNYIFCTGNKLADAILTDKADTLQEDIRIEYSGIIPQSIENVDLCVILSNALDNAAEACKQCNSPCVISVCAMVSHGYFVITFKNPTINSDNFYGIPPTTKADKEAHGIGLINIESTAKKYCGHMNIKCENHVFELSLTLKL